MAAFLGPFIGAGVRPIGGWLADKIDSGSRITLIALFVMLFASIAVLFGIQTHSFALFFGAFLLLFLTTGFVNGASFRMIPYIFNNPFHSSLVTGFTAAIAAYGAFLIHAARVSKRSRENVLDTEKVMRRPDFWWLPFLEWLVLISTILWFLVICTIR